MPIWLRLFTFNKIKKFYDEEREAMEKNALQNKSKKEIAKPNIPQTKNPSPPPSNKPTYTTKASKK